MIKVNYREQIKECSRIVVKVGTSTLTYDNGNINLTRIEKLTRVLSDLMNSGKEVVLVTSGAVGVGVNKLKLKEKPTIAECIKPIKLILLDTYWKGRNKIK